MALSGYGVNMAAVVRLVIGLSISLGMLQVYTAPLPGAPAAPRRSSSPPGSDWLQLLIVADAGSAMLERLGFALAAWRGSRRPGSLRRHGGVWVERRDELGGRHRHGVRPGGDLGPDAGARPRPDCRFRPRAGAGPVGADRAVDRPAARSDLHPLAARPAALPPLLELAADGCSSTRSAARWPGWPSASSRRSGGSRCTRRGTCARSPGRCRWWSWCWPSRWRGLGAGAEAARRARRAEAVAYEAMEARTDPLDPTTGFLRAPLRRRPLLAPAGQGPRVPGAVALVPDAGGGERRLRRAGRGCRGDRGRVFAARSCMSRTWPYGYCRSRPSRTARRRCSIWCGCGAARSWRGSPGRSRCASRSYRRSTWSWSSATRWGIVLSARRTSARGSRRSRTTRGRSAGRRRCAADVRLAAGEGTGPDRGRGAASVRARSRRHGADSRPRNLAGPRRRRASPPGCRRRSRRTA